MTPQVVSATKESKSLIPVVDQLEDALATFQLEPKGAGLKLANTVEGDPLVQTAVQASFTLESGSVISKARIGFAVYATNLKEGETPADREVILLHPALTGTSRFKLSDPKAGSQGDGWASGWAGSGVNPSTNLPYFFDTDRYTVIGLDHFGGRSIGEAIGATSASELGALAEEVTLRDGVRLTAQILQDQLGIDSIKAVIGGSMGGGQAFDWLFQDTIPVGQIFDISGCGTLDSNAKQFFSMQEKFLRQDQAISQNIRLLCELISDGLPAQRRTQGFSEAVDHVAARFEEYEGGTLADPDNIEVSKLFAVRQLGFLLFVTPEFFEEKRELGIDVGQWLDRQGAQFARRFDAAGLASLCGMIAKAPPLDARHVLNRLEELGSTQLIRASTRGDTLFPAEQQFDFNRDIRASLSRPELLTEYFSSDYRNGHDRFFTGRFLKDDAEFFRGKLEGII